MRNLKKILALVLALIMSLSLMATAGATDFKDDADVSDNYRQAVEVLSELGVFGGDQNGKLNPTDPIKRSEAAALLYRLVTGDTGDEGNKAYAPYNQFTDVMTEDWFAGYVTYCANAGYIKGRAHNDFDPNANVTGYEILTMILRAVGYDKNNEFVGSNWQLNTASIAREKGVLVNVLKDPAVKLSEPASRQVVGELLFRASLLPQVTWNAATLSYDANRDTLAKENLGLEELTGVVMANEYADLDGDTPIDAGTTRVDVDGKNYTLDIGSELNDIGELRHAFVVDGTHVLGELEDRGDSNVAEAANDGGEGSRVADVAKQAGLKLDENTTEYFVNFGEDWDYDSPWYIEYSVTFDTGTVPSGINPNNYGRNLFASNYIDVYRVKWENGISDVGVGNNEKDPKNLDKDLYYDGTTPNEATFTKIIRAGTRITSADLKIMEGIFKAADAEQTPIAGAGRSNGITGYVHGGGTNSSSSTGANANRNLAITMTWNQFYDEYINSGEMSYRESDNGEWLKIIDNDGDNVADYVLRTDFVMTTIDRYNNNNDTYTVEYRVDGNSVEIPVGSVSAKGHLNVGDVQVMETVAADKLSVKDVIMYTLIDGVYHVNIPTPVKAAVSKVDKTNLTFTCGEDVYNWSGIDERAVNYHDEAVDGVAGTEYNLYLDQFGYIRLYTEAAKGFALLLDAYYDTDARNNYTYKVEAWDIEQDKSVDWDVKSPADFIDTRSGGGISDSLDNRGTWTRLMEFGAYRYQPYTTGSNPVLDIFDPYYGHYIPAYNNQATKDLVKAGYTTDPFWTNVAAYTRNADGMYILSDPEGMIANTTTYHSYEVDTASWTVASQNMDGITSWTAAGAYDKNDSVRIRANSQTVYYYVTNYYGSISVEYWEGYGKFANAANTYGADRVYAITAEVPGLDSTNYYELAQVIVIERTLGDAALLDTGYFALWAPTDRNYPGATYVARSADNSQNYDPRYIYTLGNSSDGFVTGISLPITQAYYTERGLLNFYGYGRSGAYLIKNTYDTGTEPTDATNPTNNALTNNYEAHGISAGRVVSWDGLSYEFDLNRGPDPITTAAGVREELSYDVKTWIVVPYGQSNTFGGYDLKLCSNSQHNDRVLYMYNEVGKVAAVINVDRSIAENPGNEAIADSLNYLWNAVCHEIVTYSVSTAPVVELYGVRLQPGTNATPITWKTATDFGEDGDDAVSVTGPSGTRYWVAPKPALSNPKNAQTITITVQVGNNAPVTYTVTRSAARGDNTLNDTRSGDFNGTITNTTLGANYNASNAPGMLPSTPITIDAWLSNFVPSAGAEVEYVIQVSGYITVGPCALEDMPDYVKYARTNEIEGIRAIVTAEDGDTATINDGTGTIESPQEAVEDTKTDLNTAFGGVAERNQGSVESLKDLLDEKLAAVENATTTAERNHAYAVLDAAIEMVNSIAEYVTDPDEGLNEYDDQLGHGLSAAGLQSRFVAVAANNGLTLSMNNIYGTATVTESDPNPGVVTPYLKRSNCYAWTDPASTDILQCDYTIALKTEVDGETVEVEYTWTWSCRGMAYDQAVADKDWTFDNGAPSWIDSDGDGVKETCIVRKLAD